jgi:hypothetical protein
LDFAERHFFNPAAAPVRRHFIIWKSRLGCERQDNNERNSNLSLSKLETGMGNLKKGLAGPAVSCPAVVWAPTER